MSLFDTDEDYKRQDAVAELTKKKTEAYQFIGFRIVKCCINCHFYNNAKCSVMQKFNGVILDVSDFGICKHFIADKNNNIK